MTRTLLLVLLLAACGDSTTPVEPQETESSVAAPLSGDPVSMPSSEVQASRSRLEFETLEIDFGTVYQEQDFEVAFPFRVDGPDPVTITGLDPTCGCTDVYLTVNGKDWDLGTPIPSGAEGAVRGQFHSANYADLKTSVINVTGDFLNAPMRLHLQAFIRRHFTVTPSVLGFGTLPLADLGAQAASAQVKITGSEPFEITRWTRLPRGFEVNEVGEPENLEDGRQVRTFEVRLTKENSAGVLTQTLQADTSLHKGVSLSITAHLLGPVQLKPATALKFGAVNQGLKPRRALQIIATDPNAQLPPPEVEFVGSDQFTWDLSERVPGREWVVRVHFQGDVDPGRYAGQLKVSFPEEVGADLPPIKVNALVRARS